MAILGTLIKKGIKLRENFHQAYSSPFDLQKNELRSLLFAARNTRFGTFYGFDQILSHFRKGHTDFFREFTSTVPLHDYIKINKEWWHLTRKGIKHVTWPGRTRYFALSSGTSDAASKQIPVTRDMTKAIQRTSIRQILSLSKYDLPPEFFEGGIMMIGGSTHLSKKGSFFEGDLSGIQAARLPFWFQHFYKPGKQIARGRDWEKKLDDITRNARKWDISIIVGVPAWIQLLLKKIIDHYQLNNIHELWPNLMVYVHGGVSFDPYRKGFEQLLGRPIWYIETYLASEGFIAYQDTPKSKTMKLVLDNGIFFEFIPFDDDHFLPTGEVRPEAATIMIDQVAEGVEYAVVLSTCAGAWRYMIGDVIRFISKEEAEIVITGRTKHFLSLCGEHLSVDNMNKAIELLSEEFNVSIPEFTVAGIPDEKLFAHRWFIGCDKKVDVKKFADRLDHHLRELNDDYGIERIAALGHPMVEIHPTNTFYRFMKMKGKSGGQHKFPRVIKGSMIDEWVSFLNA